MSPTQLKSIEAGELQLGKLFTEDFEFSIPDYQRPYSWGEDETLELLDDLQSALERDVDEPYFLGSAVLVKEKTSPQADVIDGQQRLTTLTILFAVLRDLASEQDLVSEIQGFIEEPAKAWAGTSAQPRLSLRDRDRLFFQKHVQTPGGIAALIDLADNYVKTDAQWQIRANTACLFDRLADWTSDRRKQLFSMLGARTFLVIVSTPDLNSAYRIFSVMNSRGLPLAPSDIFKSQVIGEMPESNRSLYADGWEDLEEELGRDEFDDLFVQIRKIVAKTRGEKNLLEEFPEQVLKQYLPRNAAAFFDDILYPYAQADLLIVHGDHEPNDAWKDVNGWFARLLRTANNDWRPAALWVLKNHKDDTAYLQAFLRRLERLAASLLLRGVRATQREIRYLDLLRQLDAGDGVRSTALSLSETEKAESLERLESDLYLATAVVSRYVLLRLDSLMANDPGATYSAERITVEHVLPQGPKEDSQWATDFTEADRIYWTHRLGNLVLLNRSKNSEARNYDFQTKKEKYFTGKKGVAVFALTTQVLQHDSWTPAVVAERQESLVSLLATEWDFLPS